MILNLGEFILCHTSDFYSIDIVINIHLKLCL
jgi:hypothetical protein